MKNYIQITVLAAGLCVAHAAMADPTVKVVNYLGVDRQGVVTNDAYKDDWIRFDFYPEGENVTGVWVAPGASREKKTESSNSKLDNIKLYWTGPDQKVIKKYINYYFPSDKQGTWILFVYSDKVEAMHSSGKLNTTYIQWPLEELP